MIHVDLEDIEGVGDVQIGDRITLKVTAKVVSLREAEYEGSSKTEAGMEIEKIAFADRAGKEAAEKEPAETE